MTTFFRKFLIALASLAFVLQVQAMSVLPMYLDEIVKDATVAFDGECISNRSEVDAKMGVVVTYTTFKVTEVLRGKVGANHTIKQLGGSTAGQMYRLPGMTTFLEGTPYVVFLYGVSSAGFSSPVGLSQGQFTIRDGASGKELSNGRDFKEMLRPEVIDRLPPNVKRGFQQTTGPLSQVGLVDFKQMVRQLDVTTP
jgi:hypothetical protein